MRMMDIITMVLLLIMLLYCWLCWCWQYNEITDDGRMMAATLCKAYWWVFGLLMLLMTVWQWHCQFHIATSLQLLLLNDDDGTVVIDNTIAATVLKWPQHTSRIEEKYRHLNINTSPYNLWYNRLLQLIVNNIEAQGLLAMMHWEWT